jgi:hypothetical protein
MLATVCMACVVVAAGCDDDASNDTGGADTATAADTSGATTAPDTSTEPDTATGADTTPDPDTADAEDDADTSTVCALVEADCPADKPRLVGCRCTSVSDRRCDDNSDCRPTESCDPVGAYNICIFTPAPPVVCPGAPGCVSSAGQPLFAAAVSKVITPDGFETPKPEGLNGVVTSFNFDQDIAPFWNDCGYDGLCPGDAGYTAPDDGEGDGIPQGAWLAGFDVSRPAIQCPTERIGCDEVDCCVSQWAHDDLMLQVVVMRQGDITIGFVSLDVVGFFQGDFKKISADLPEALGIDLVVFGATHNHEAPDTFGQWGGGTPLPVVTGRDPKFFQKIHDQAIAGLTEAVADLREADMSATVLHVGFDGLSIADSRPPYIINDAVPVVWLRDKASGDTIATMLSIGNHPEVLWSENQLITADYPHFTRHYIQQGLDAVLDPNDTSVELKPALPGVGGVTVLWAGSVGGLINPGAGGAKTYAGVEPVERHSYEAADAVGQSLASRVLSAIHNDVLVEAVAPDLRFVRREFMARIDNTVFIAATTTLNLIPREVYNVAQLNAFRFAPHNPDALTEVVVVGVGPVTFFTAPGEVFPETLTGGFPGKPTNQTPIIGDPEGRKADPTCGPDHMPTADDSGTNTCVVKRTQDNPPDFSVAPNGPYVYDLIPGDVPFFIGLGMDALGYLVPEYDYKVGSYFDSGSVPGNHYEETNGVGPDIVTDWQNALKAAIDALP